MWDIISQLRRKEKPQQKKQKKLERRFISDIILNEPPDSEWRCGREILDYTSNTKRLFEEMKSFKNGQLIKICGNIAGLCIKIRGDKYSEQRLEYDGMIILGVDSLFYFYACKSRKEVPNLELERAMLESAKSFPIFMTGIFYHDSASGFGTRFPSRISPAVLQMGGYISPQPRKGLAENE